MVEAHNGRKDGLQVLALGLWLRGSGGIIDYSDGRRDDDDRTSGDGSSETNGGDSDGDFGRGPMTDNVQATTKPKYEGQATDSAVMG